MSNFKPIIKKAVTTLGAIALLASVTFSGTTYLAKRNLEVQSKAQTDKLAKLDGDNKRLAKLYADDETRLKSLGDQLASLLPENTTLKDNIGAFAEQAGACAKLRQALKLGA